MKKIDLDEEIHISIKFNKLNEILKRYKDIKQADGFGEIEIKEYYDPADKRRKNGFVIKTDNINRIPRQKTTVNSAAEYLSTLYTSTAKKSALRSYQHAAITAVFTVGTGIGLTVAAPVFPLGCAAVATFSGIKALQNNSNRKKFSLLAQPDFFEKESEYFGVSREASERYAGMQGLAYNEEPIVQMRETAIYGDVEQEDSSAFFHPEKFSFSDIAIREAAMRDYHNSRPKEELSFEEASASLFSKQKIKKL